MEFLPPAWQTSIRNVDLDDWDLFSSYTGLLTLAALAIYTGSFGSLSYKGKPEQDDEEQVSERVSSEDAKWFPFIASGALLGLYLAIKYLGKEWINWILGWYFSIMGVGSVWKALVSFVKFIMGPARWKNFNLWTFSVKKGPSTDLFSFSCRTPALYLLPVSFLPSLLGKLFPKGRWAFAMGNIVGFSFCHNTISLLKLDTFATGCLLLSGLFLYDCWFVFGTKVMVEVATTLDIPIKLLWPKSMFFSTDRGNTLLGLGDIIIPGTFVSLALRYDYSRACRADSSPTARFPKPYFYATLMAYTSGLVTTMAVMHTFRVAQPALLYLSPACILSLVGMAVVQKDFGEMWMWSDDPDKTSAKKHATGTEKGDGDQMMKTDSGLEQ